MENNIIEMKNICISFGDLMANKNVDFSVKEGEIMALLGENGAGKSTLMKILYGLYARDKGEITVEGKKMPHKYSPMDMINLGISMVPQQFMLVDAFTVAENIILGKEKVVGKFVFNKKKAEQLVADLCEEFDIRLNPSDTVASLSLGEKQKIEILKALYRGGRVIILDEPTTILTPQEVSELFSLLKSLKKKGISVILIAHKLQEVMDVTDRITVMRLGEKVAVVNTAQTNINELAETMVGRRLNSVCVDFKEEHDAPLIKFVDVSTKKQGERCPLNNFNLELYPSRVVGIAGIDGNGQTELVEVMAGIKQIKSGSIIIDGKEIRDNSHAVMKEQGIGIIPEDRREQGLVLDLSIKDNIIIGRRKDKEFVNKGIFKKRDVNAYADELIKEFDVRPPKRDVICRFVSGGNQQKIVLARELSRPGLKTIVASQPIRGLDIGAIEFTHRTLLRFREEGKAVLLISSDLDEIMELSDYIAVLSEGEIVAFKPRNQFTVEEIGLYMGGEKAEERRDAI